MNYHKPHNYRIYECQVLNPARFGVFIQGIQTLQLQLLKKIGKLKLQKRNIDTYVKNIHKTLSFVRALN